MQVLDVVGELLLERVLGGRLRALHVAAAGHAGLGQQHAVGGHDEDRAQPRGGLGGALERAALDGADELAGIDGRPLALGLVEARQAHEQLSGHQAAPLGSVGLVIGL